MYGSESGSVHLTNGTGSGSAALVERDILARFPRKTFVSREDVYEIP
jgi:hypothetical protein